MNLYEIINNNANVWVDQMNNLYHMSEQENKMADYDLNLYKIVLIDFCSKSKGFESNPKVTAH